MLRYVSSFLSSEEVKALASVHRGTFQGMRRAVPVAVERNRERKRRRAKLESYLRGQRTIAFRLRAIDTAAEVLMILSPAMSMVTTALAIDYDWLPVFGALPALVCIVIMLTSVLLHFILFLRAVELPRYRDMHYFVTMADSPSSPFVLPSVWTVLWNNLQINSEWSELRETRNELSVAVRLIRLLNCQGVREDPRHVHVRLRNCRERVGIFAFSLTTALFLASQFAFLIVCLVPSSGANAIFSAGLVLLAFTILAALNLAHGGSDFHDMPLIAVFMFAFPPLLSLAAAIVIAAGPSVDAVAHLALAEFAAFTAYSIFIVGFLVYIGARMPCDRWTTIVLFFALIDCTLGLLCARAGSFGDDIGEVWRRRTAFAVLSPAILVVPLGFSMLFEFIYYFFGNCPCFDTCCSLCDSR